MKEVTRGTQALNVLLLSASSNIPMWSSGEPLSSVTVMILCFWGNEEEGETVEDEDGEGSGLLLLGDAA